MLIKSILSNEPNTVLRVGMIVASQRFDYLVKIEGIDIKTNSIFVHGIEPDGSIEHAVCMITWIDGIRCADSAEKRIYRNQLKQR